MTRATKSDLVPGIMPTVLITPEPLIGAPGPHITLLEEAGFGIAFPEDTTFTRGLVSEQETIDVLRGHSAVIAGGEFFTPKVLAELNDLRVIARAGVGYDRVDVAAATERGIAVTITPTANHESVAEQTFALLFAVAKSVVLHDKAARAGRWPNQLTEPVRGKTLGILGLGRIGRSVAVRALAMRMEVIATEPFPDEAFLRRCENIELVDFDTLLARSDYLTIHCPLNEKTAGLMNRDSFARMKPGSVLINTARGKLVAEADLMDALTNGPLSGAGLDVFEDEPVSPDNPLLRMDRIVISPHLAGIDKRAQADMAIEAANCIIRLHRGEWPREAVVNEELRQGWKW